MSTATPVSNLTMPTCATCPYFSAVHNGESSTCRYNPPPFSVVQSVDWCRMHPDFAQWLKSTKGI